jgi:hypothetical protein
LIVNKSSGKVKLNSDVAKREGGIANEIGLNTILEVSNISGIINE